MQIVGLGAQVASIQAAQQAGVVPSAGDGSGSDGSGPAVVADISPEAIAASLLHRDEVATAQMIAKLLPS